MYSSFLSRDMLSEIDRLQREMRRAFDTMTPSIRGFAQGFPALNIGSTSSSVEIYAFAPGIDPASLQVDIDRRVLTIAGTRAEESKDADEQSTAHIGERFHGRFRRVVTLPEDIDSNAVDARYRDGVLHIAVKRREATRPRRISVQ